MDMITRAIGPDAAPVGQVCPVNSHNEWDPLEEVIVGRLEGATIPSDHPVVTCNIPGMTGRAQSLLAGFRYPKIMIEPAQRELDAFVALLQSLGIVVRRPEPVEHKKRFITPEWSSCGFCNSVPRDSMLVIRDEITEGPLSPSHASRYRHIADWAWEDCDQSRIHRRRPSPGDLKKMGHPCGF